ncbi:MAG TPA: TolC family protein [Kofleriaceae bacterium]
MRFSRLACLLFALIAGAPSGAHADVVGRALKAAEQQPGGGAAWQTPDLIEWAGEPRAITLPELLQITVRQAPNLAAAQIDIAVAEARIEQTWARNDWQVQAQLKGVRTGEVPQGTTTINNDTQIGGTFDLSRALPTGGTVDLHAQTGYDRLNYTVNLMVGGQSFAQSGTSTTWTNDISGSITQPLLRKRGRRLFEANEIKATLARDVSVLARRLAAIQTVQTVISAYWDLVLAEQTVAITQGSLDLARERLRVTQIGADGGKVPRSEIPAVLQIIATRQEDVLSGELGVLNASIAMRRAAGMPIGPGELGLRVATDLDTRDQPINLGELVERAFAASPELAQLAKQDASATIDVEVAEDGLLPQLDAALTLGPTGTGSSFSDSAKDLATFKSIAITGTLTFTQSLGRHDALGRTREQRELKRKLTVNAADLRAQLAQTMSRSVAQLELARRRVTLSQRAIDLANENIKIETDRFNLGKSTNFDVLNRLEELRQAELRKAQALIDWRKAEVVIQSLTGDLLPMYGISVD